METHLEQYLYQPQKLLEDLRATDAQQFHTAMKCLLEDKWGHLVRLAWQLPTRSSRTVDICWAIFDSFLFSPSPLQFGTLGPGFFPLFLHVTLFLLFFSLFLLLRALRILRVF